MSVQSTINNMSTYYNTAGIDDALRKMEEKIREEQRKEKDLEEVKDKARLLRMAEVITPGEFRRVLKLIYSPDHENHLMAQEIVNQKMSEL